MKCPQCGKDENRVFSVPDNFMLPVKFRNRLCLACGYRFITEERATGHTWGRGAQDGDTVPMFTDDETYIHRREQAKAERDRRIADRIAQQLKRK